ncbi:MAG: ABC transporter ATP-binding protein [Nocardioides sp.]
MSALEVRGVTASYGAAPVLRGVDLTVTDGVTAVLGSSGCGKTTLLRVVAGFLAPDTGTITIAGREVAGSGRAVPPRRRNIGYVPQEGALFPHLSVAANIGFGLPRSERRGSVRIDEMLELVELPRDLADRFPHQLSGGQQQRVALARALAARPALVLLDEPFSSLDAGLREETGRAVARALRASKAAGVLVTHDQGEALSLADQVAVMSEGRFLQVATPADVYLSPADESVAAFLGHAVLLTGTLGTDEVAQCALGALRVRGAVPAGPVVLAVRAEQVRVSADTGSLGAGTLGTVLDVSFFGHDATIRVRLDAGEVLTARTPAGAIPHPGDRVGVLVDGDVVAFPGAAR